MSWINKRTEAYRKGARVTMAEKAILAHADPINLSLFSIGMLITAYGLWQHDWRLIIGGLVVGLSGDVISWMRT